MPKSDRPFSNLNDFDLAKLIMRDNWIVPDIPKERYSSIHIVRAALKSNYQHLQFIPKQYWDDIVKFNIFISNKLEAFRDESLLTNSVINMLMEYSSESIKKIPHHLQTAQAACKAVGHDIILIVFINHDLIPSVIEKALSAQINHEHGFSIIKRIYKDDLPQALANFNDIILRKGDGIYYESRKVIYRHRLGEIEPSRLREMAQRLKAFEAYRDLTSTEEALQLMNDAGVKRQWLEGDLSL